MSGSGFVSRAVSWIRHWFRVICSGVSGYEEHIGTPDGSGVVSDILDLHRSINDQTFYPGARRSLLSMAKADILGVIEEQMSKGDFIFSRIHR